MSKFKSNLSFLILGLVLLACGQDAATEKGEQKQAKESVTGGMAVQTVTLPVEGMSCSSCVSNVKKTVKALAGVQDVAVSLEKRQATITYVGEKISPEQISKAINDQGYKTGKPTAEN